MLFVLFSSCTSQQNSEVVSILELDSSNAFQINNAWYFPLKEMGFNSVEKQKKDTLSLVVCSDFVYFPFGVIKKREDISSSILKDYKVDGLMGYGMDNLDSIQDTLWDLEISLMSKNNYVTLFLDNDPNASIHSNVHFGELIDKGTRLINGVYIGMKYEEFIGLFFGSFPMKKEDRFQIIELISCVNSIRHRYIFRNDELISIQFNEE